MREKLIWYVWFGLVGLTVSVATALCQAKSETPLGIFESHADVGTVLHPGDVQYDTAKQTYTISGSGENMWLGADAFHFVWKKVSGDVMLTSDISFIGAGGNPHRKAVLMVRQNLDADSAYADVALHGVGLTSLQFREKAGAMATHEVEASESGPKRVRIIKRGDYLYMSLGNDGATLHTSGASIKLPLQSPFYIGIGVCSHDKDVVERAVFSNVEIVALPAVPTKTPLLYSALETIAVASTDRRVMYVARGRFEAPNWTHDGNSFIFNRDGRLYRLPVAGSAAEAIDTGFAKRCNNDHGISPDGKLLAISDQSAVGNQSLVYTVPIDGGSPQRVTAKSPSYWHGWSPDEKTIVFTGQRDGEFDIYSIPANGGEETRLTTAKGLNDGPEYSPDGKYIYFNSERTGQMQIWRMAPDGSQQEQVTFDESNDWFPHISPDGKWMVFLSYEKDVSGHPADKDVTLHLMSLADGKVTVLTKLFGVQGTINVPSWSPDSLKLAFVSYEMLPDEGGMAQ